MRLFTSAAILSLLATTALAGPTVTEIKAPDLPLDATFDDVATSPSLEQLSADDIDNMPKKIEGVAVMSPTEMIVISDSDFGIEGDETRISRVTFPEPVLQ